MLVRKFRAALHFKGFVLKGLLKGNICSVNMKLQDPLPWQPASGRINPPVTSLCSLKADVNITLPRKDEEMQNTHLGTHASFSRKLEENNTDNGLFKTTTQSTDVVQMLLCLLCTTFGQLEGVFARLNLLQPLQSTVN